MLALSPSMMSLCCLESCEFAGEKEMDRGLFLRDLVCESLNDRLKVLDGCLKGIDGVR